MILSFLGLALILYVLFYIVCNCVLDCDIELAFYEKFGKSIGTLQGKVVFITGASSGIGEHTALALAKHGVKLVLAARKREELERVQRACIALSKGKLTKKDVLVLQIDMKDFHSHEMKFNDAIQHFGQVDILLNNAGRSQRAKCEKIDMKVHRDSFELNVFSVINLSNIAIKYFYTVGKGHVAVTSSIGVVIPIPLAASYISGKHAIHGYFNSLKYEKMMENFNLGVTILCPGPTFTNSKKESYTDTPGEKYGIPTHSTDRRITAERCGELCAIAIANNAKESWIGIFPTLPLSYLFAYHPVLCDIVVKLVGAKNIFRFRDSEDIDK